MEKKLKNKLSNTLKHKEVKPFKGDKPRIYLIDVTNRDGVQTARLCLAKLEKTILNTILNDMGIYQSEFGFPTTHHETNYLRANLELAKRGELYSEAKPHLYPIKLSGWLRAIPQDVELAYNLVPEIEHLNLSISTSDIMTTGKFKNSEGIQSIYRTPEEMKSSPTGKANILSMMTDAVDLAREKGTKSIGVNAEDASRTDDKYLIRFAEAAKEHGAQRIRYCDTLGADDPLTIYKRINRLAKEVELPIELHCHNDLGMAVATSLAGALGAIDAGVDAYINTTVNAMGERAGNCDLVSIILAIKNSSIMKDSEKYSDILDPNIKLDQSARIAKYASYAFNIPIPINQVGVGANAFSHASGIHADGILKDSKNYELYHFSELGIAEIEQLETGRQIILNEYSGTKGFVHIMGKYDLIFKTDKQRDLILELVRYANVHTQKPVTGEELIFIYHHPDIAAKVMTVSPPFLE